MVVTAVALFVYVATLAPSITFENTGADSGDLVTAAQTLGIPHPPGYPTYTLLAWLSTRLPFGTSAYRVNLLSAISAALAVGLACRIAQLLLGNGWINQLIAAAAALTLALSTLFWSQAVIAEVYALLALFAAMLFWLLLRWREGGSDANLWLSALLLGLGLGNHLTLVFIAPAALVLLWPQRRRWFRARVLVPAAGLFLLGLGTYAYLPLAAQQRPLINWGNPQTWDGFLWVVTAEQYQQFVFGLPLAEIAGRLGLWSLRFGDQFGWWGLALALAGGMSWWQRDRSFLLACLAWMLPLGAYAFFYDTSDSYVYFLPVLLLLSIWWAGGSRYLVNLLRDKVQNQLWSRIVLAIIVILPVASLALHWNQVDLSDDWYAYAYAFQAVDDVEPGSLIIVRGDKATFALWYAVYAEGRRSDVSIVSGPMLAFIWYRDHVRHLYPDLVVIRPTGEREITIDDLVITLISDNLAQMPVYATDPKDEWKDSYDFVEQEAPIFRVQPRSKEEQSP